MKTKKFTSTDAYNSIRGLCDTIAAKGSTNKRLSDSTHAMLQHGLRSVSLLAEKHGRKGADAGKPAKKGRFAPLLDNSNNDGAGCTRAVTKT